MKNAHGQDICGCGCGHSPDPTRQSNDGVEHGNTSRKITKLMTFPHQTYLASQMQIFQRKAPPPLCAEWGGCNSGAMIMRVRWPRPDLVRGSFGAAKSRGRTAFRSFPGPRAITGCRCLLACCVLVHRATCGTRELRHPCRGGGHQVLSAAEPFF